MPKLRSSAFWHSGHPTPLVDRDRFTYSPSIQVDPLFRWTLSVMNGVWAADNRHKDRADSEGLAHRVAWFQALPFILGSWEHLVH